jgi:5'-methylthioadenosine phosphorylase
MCASLRKRLKEEAEIGIFGGTGNYDPTILEDVKEIKVYTPYGAPSDDVIVGWVKDRKIAFLARHGRKHTIPPHKVNFRANVWAMKELGVTRIISPAAAGSLVPEVDMGEFVVCDQIIDRTLRRNITFYDGGVVCHVSMADPFCGELRDVMIKTGKGMGLKIHDKGTFVCIEGPRFSTRAESAMYRQWGGTVIGMTVWPEAPLAREVEICFCSVAMVTDKDVYGHEVVSAELVVKTMRENVKNVNNLICAAIPKIPKERHCDCGKVLDASIQ